MSILIKVTIFTFLLMYVINLKNRNREILKKQRKGIKKIAYYRFRKRVKERFHRK